MPKERGVGWPWYRAGALALICLFMAWVAGCAGNSELTIFKTTGQSMVSKASKGSIFGRVVGEDGRPAPGVVVVAYLANGSPLVGNNAGSYRVASGTTSTKTDADGNYILTPATTGTYNLQAAQSDDKKAWKAFVRSIADVSVDAGLLKIAPTGSISGRIKSSNPNVTDFSDTQVYIPGSGYSAFVKADGTYTIANVPVGTFGLRGYSVNLGDGQLADDAITVASGVESTAPDILLAVTPPEISSITLADSDRSVDNAAPQTDLEIHGSHFGFSRGSKFEVRFTAATATSTKQLAEDRIRVTVPNGALDGSVMVVVGGNSSNAVPFRVIRSLDVASASMIIAKGDTLDLFSLLVARDSDQAVIQEVKDGGSVKRNRPTVSWSSNSNNVYVSDSGMLSALGTGKARLTAQAGQSTLAVTLDLAIVEGPLPGSVTSPAPVITPAPSPNPSPSPSQGQPQASPPVSASANPVTPTLSPTPPPMVRWIASLTSTIAGNGQPGFADTVLDMPDPALHPELPPMSTVKTPGQLSGPAAIGISDSNTGVFYVADTGNNRLRMISLGTDPAPSVLTTYAGSGQAGFADGAMAIMPPITTLPGQFNGPEGVATYLSGGTATFVSDTQNHLIRMVRWNQTGQLEVSTIAGSWTGAPRPGNANGTAKYAQFNLPKGLCVPQPITYVPSGIPSLPAYGPDSLLIADSGNNQIRYIDHIALLTAPPGAPAPGAAAVSSNVEILAGSSLAGLVNGDAATAQFKNPSGVVTDSAGNVFVTDTGNNCIRKITGNQVSVFVGSADGSPGYSDGTGTSARFSGPTGITIDGYNNLFVADTANNRIRMVSPIGQVSTIAGNGSTGTQSGDGPTTTFFGPRGIAVSRQGDLVVADTGNHEIRRIIVPSAGANPAR